MSEHDEMLQIYKETATLALWKVVCTECEEIINWDTFCQIEKDLFDGIEELLSDIHLKISYYVAGEENATPFAAGKFNLANERLMYLGIPAALIAAQTHGFVNFSEKVSRGRAADRLSEKMNRLDALMETLEGEKKIQYKAALCNMASLWGNVIISLNKNILGKEEKNIKSLIQETLKQTEPARAIIRLAGASEEDITEFVKAYIAFGCPLVSV